MLKKTTGRVEIRKDTLQVERLAKYLSCPRHHHPPLAKRAWTQCQAHFLNSYLLLTNTEQRELRTSGGVFNPSRLLTTYPFEF